MICQYQKFDFEVIHAFLNIHLEVGVPGNLEHLSISLLTSVDKHMPEEIANSEKLKIH